MEGLLRHLHAEGTLANLARQAGAARAVRTPSFYMGVDPTAASLHVGHLVGIAFAGRLARATGWRPVFVVGGATARLGDPSMRASARSGTCSLAIADNARRIAGQMQNIASRLRLPVPALVLDNAQWTSALGLLDFLAGPCGRMRVSWMLHRESVAQRLASAEGLSFGELAYQLLQARDFAHLRDAHGVLLQIGGSDQWGNMLAGLELMRRMCSDSDAMSYSNSTCAADDSSATEISSAADEQHDAHGSECPVMIATYPLLSDGATREKMGKSAGNAVWLDAAQTSAFAMYQYLLRRTDADSMAAARLVLDCAPASPADAPRAVAAELTRLAHGDAALASVEAACAVLYGPGGYTSEALRSPDAEGVAAFMRSSAGQHVAIGDDVRNMRIVDALAEHTARSRRSLRRMAQAGGVLLDGAPADADALDAALGDRRRVFVRIGKSQHVLIERGE